MKASEHPARHPPAPRQQPFVAADEPRVETTPGYVGPTEPEVAEREEPEPVQADEGGERSTSPGYIDPPSAEWDTNLTAAPRDSKDVLVRYGDEERLVRWKEGRRFDGRRWIAGGRWMPADSMMPLPASQPDAWLRQPEYEPEQQPEVAA